MGDEFEQPSPPLLLERMLWDSVPAGSKATTYFGRHRTVPVSFSLLTKAQRADLITKGRVDSVQLELLVHDADGVAISWFSADPELKDDRLMWPDTVKALATLEKAVRLLAELSPSARGALAPALRILSPQWPEPRSRELGSVLEAIHDLRGRRGAGAPVTAPHRTAAAVNGLIASWEQRTGRERRTGKGGGTPLEFYRTLLPLLKVRGAITYGRPDGSEEHTWADVASFNKALLGQRKEERSAFERALRRSKKLPRP